MLYRLPKLKLFGRELRIVKSRPIGSSPSWSPNFMLTHEEPSKGIIVARDSSKNGLRVVILPYFPRRLWRSKLIKIAYTCGVVSLQSVVTRRHSLKYQDYSSCQDPYLLCWSTPIPSGRKPSELTTKQQQPRWRGTASNFRKYAYLHIIVFNNGTQFSNDGFKQFCEEIDTFHLAT